MHAYVHKFYTNLHVADDCLNFLRFFINFEDLKGDGFCGCVIYVNSRRVRRILKGNACKYICMGLLF